MRLAPKDPPYAPDVEASFAKLMPDGQPPLALFRVLAHNPRVLRRIQRGGLLDPGAVSVRARELVILRTCALCGAGYEWGVHARFFGPAAELDDASLDATWTHGSSWTGFAAQDRLVLRLAESLAATRTLDAGLYAELGAFFAPEALVELVVLAGLYHAVSFVVNAFEVPAEPFGRTPPG